MPSAPSPRPAASSSPLSDPASGVAAADFRAWGCENRLVVSDPSVVADAHAWLVELMDAVELRAGTHLEHTLLDAAAPAGHVGADDRLSVGLVVAAGWAEEFTQGRVTPFVGAASLAAWGFGDVPVPGQIVVGEDGSVTWPAGRRLDLGATAKATTADLAALRIASRWDTSVLVSLGGDIATAGPRRWGVRVQDLPGDPLARIEMDAGWAVATSSTQKRRWRGAGGPDGGASPEGASSGDAMLGGASPGGAGETLRRSHVLDPATLRPVEAHWRTVSVVAPSCLEANAIATEALVAGPLALRTLRSHGRAARLVDLDGAVVHVGGWPEDSEELPEVRLPQYLGGGAR